MVYLYKLTFKKLGSEEEKNREMKFSVHLWI